MDSINTQLEVLETCSALSRLRTSWSIPMSAAVSTAISDVVLTAVPTAVPTSGIAMACAVSGADLQGTGTPFAVVRSVTPRKRHYGSSGLTAWIPPV